MKEWIEKNHGLISVFIQAFGLAFVSWQVHQAGLTFGRELRKDQIEEALILHRHKQDTNRLLLDKSDAAALLHMPPQQDILGFTLINDYQNLLLLRCNRLLSNQIWGEIEDVIYSQLKPQGSLRDFWDKNSKAYPPKFINYIRNLASSENGPNKNQEERECKVSKD